MPLHLTVLDAVHCVYRHKHTHTALVMRPLLQYIVVVAVVDATKPGLATKLATAMFETSVHT